MRGKRVLLLEDDVISGISLELVMQTLAPYEPATVSVYIGRRADSQCPENVPVSVNSVFLAEVHLDQSARARYENEFVELFGLDK